MSPPKRYFSLVYIDPYSSQSSSSSSAAAAAAASASSSPSPLPSSPPSSSPSPSPSHHHHHHHHRHHHHHHHHHVTLAFCDKIIYSERIFSVNQDWGMVWVVHISHPPQAWLLNLPAGFKLSAANMVNNINDMQDLTFSNLAWIQMDHSPSQAFKTCTWKSSCLNTDHFITILFAIVLVWIATKQTVGTNVKRLAYCK